MYVCMYVCMYVRMYVCMYVGMYVCMYVCMRIYTISAFQALKNIHFGADLKYFLRSHAPCIIAPVTFPTHNSSTKL